MATLEDTNAQQEIGALQSADTLARVKQAVLEAMGLDNREFARETSLTNDLNANSLDLVEISMALEETFGVEFGEDTLLLTTAGQLVDYIEAKTANAELDIPYM